MLKCYKSKMRKIQIVGHEHKVSIESVANQIQNLRNMQ